MSKDAEAPRLGGDGERTGRALTDDVRPARSRRGPLPGTRPRGRHTYLVHPGAVEGLAAVVEQRWVSRPEVLEVALTELLSWLEDPASAVRAEELLATLPNAPDRGQGKVVAIDTYADTRERLAGSAQRLRVSMNRLVNLAIVVLVAGAAPRPAGGPSSLESRRPTSNRRWSDGCAGRCGQSSTGAARPWG